MSNIIDPAQMNLIITNVVTGNKGSDISTLREAVLKALILRDAEVKTKDLLDEIDSKIKQKITELSK